MSKKITAHVFNGVYWSGWSTKYGVIFSIKHAKSLISRDIELGFYIIDGNKKTAFVSDTKFIKKAISTAKQFFDVEVKSVSVGLPKVKKCSSIIRIK